MAESGFQPVETAHRRFGYKDGGVTKKLKITNYELFFVKNYPKSKKIILSVQNNPKKTKKSKEKSVKSGKSVDKIIFESFLIILD